MKMPFIIHKAFRHNRYLTCYSNQFNQHKKTLVFVHTIGGSAENWKRQIRKYINTHNIICYDLYGHGSSGVPYTAIECGLVESVLDLQSILNHFNAPKVTLIAHGYGALVAATLSSIFVNNIEKLIVLNPYFHTEKNKRRPLGRSIYITMRRLYDKLYGTNNNASFRPKIQVERYYYYGIHILPSIINKSIEYNALKVPLVAIFNKNYKLWIKIGKTNNKDNDIELRTLENLQSFPMYSNAEKINSLLDEYIDVLDTQAFRNLIFEGGGFKGCAYGGAIKALEQMNVLPHIKRLAGTSAGAIYAIFIAIGMKGDEIIALISSLNYEDFADSSKRFIANSARLVSEYGWYKGDKFMHFMHNLIGKYLGNGDITFRQLHEQTHYELYIIGTNLTLNCAEIYSLEHTPDMKIIDALRISTCAPMIFKAIKEKRKDQEHVLVDGGLVWNCPIDLFDNRKYVYNVNNIVLKKDNSVKNMETLAFRLDSKSDPFAPFKENMQNKEYKKITSIVDFTKRFMTFYGLNVMQKHMEKDNWDRTVFIDTLNIEAFDFKISTKNIERLVYQGKQGVYNHFSWRMGFNGLKYPQ